MNTLAVEKRVALGKHSKSLKNDGFMPAVVYGPKQEPVSLTVSLREFERVLKSAGESSVVELSGLGGSPMQVLIHEVHVDPVTSVPRHVDFYAIEKGAKVEVAVQLSFIGESPAVKAGANLVKVLHEVEIEADAAKLPHEIEVDISSLVNVGDQIHVSDLKMPAGVTLQTDLEEVIVLIQAAHEEVEEEAGAAPDMSAIEVEKKGKEEGEEGAEEAAA
jgi:large subunit ribosomal protein L25